MEERDKSPTTPMCSIKGKTNNECDAINVSEADLNPCVKTDLKVKSGCQPTLQKSKHLIIQFWLNLNGSYICFIYKASKKKILMS